MTENALQKEQKMRSSELPKQGFRIGGVAKIMISKGREKYTKKLPKVVPKSMENRLSFGSRRVPKNGDAKTIDKASTHTPKGSQIEPKMGAQMGELLSPGPPGCPRCTLEGLGRALWGRRGSISSSLGELGASAVMTLEDSGYCIPRF